MKVKDAHMIQNLWLIIARGRLSGAYCQIESVKYSKSVSSLMLTRLLCLLLMGAIGAVSNALGNPQVLATSATPVITPIITPLTTPTAVTIRALVNTQKTASPPTLFDLGSDVFHQLNDQGSFLIGAVTSLGQDSHGYMWIGTLEGLRRYDGYSFKSFKHDSQDLNSLAGNIVRKIHVSKSGNLWVYSNGGLSLYQEEDESFRNFRTINTGQFALPAVQAMMAAEDGGLWIATAAGLEYLDPKTGLNTVLFNTRNKPISTHSISFNSLLQRDNGDLLIGTDIGLTELKAGRKTLDWSISRQSNKAFGYRKRIRSLQLDSNGIVWVGTDKNGLFYLDENKQVKQVVKGGIVEYKNQAIVNMIQVRDNELWITLGSGGVAVVDINTKKHLRRIRSDKSVVGSIRSDVLRAMYKDRSGILWIGHRNNGIDLYNTKNQAFSSVLSNRFSTPAIDIPSVSSVGVLPNNNVILGYQSLKILDPKLGSINPKSKHLVKLSTDKNVFISTAIVDDKQRLWLRNNKNQLLKLDLLTDEMSVIGRDRGIDCEKMSTKMLLGPESNIWLLCEKRPRVIRYNPRTKEIWHFDLDKRQMLGRNTYGGLIFDGSGRLWVGSATGLYYLDDANRSAKADVKKSEMLGNKVVGGLLKDKNGFVWADTFQGLYRQVGKLSERKFEYINEQANLRKSQVFTNMQQSSDGRIWGVSGVLNPDPLSFYKFHEIDGIAIGEIDFGSFATTKDGLFLFGGVGGLLIIDPRRFEPWVYDPPLVVSQLIVDGVVNKGLIHDSIVLTPQNERFSIDVAALDYSAPESNQYAYRLMGYDSNWQYVDAKNRRISYSRLPPGEYRLQVKGSNRVGEWASQQLDIRIVAQPAWYQTIWFRIVGALVFTMLLYGFYRYRIRHLKDQQSLLENKVAIRTAELDDRNLELEDKTEELTTMLEELNRAQAQMIEQEKMASLGSLVAGVAHEVNTPIGIGVTAASHLQESANNMLAAYKSGSMTQDSLETFLSKAKTSADLLLSNLTRSAKLISSFKEVAVNQSSDMRMKFNVHDTLKNIVDSLANEFSRGDFTLDLQCDPNWTMNSYPGAMAQVFTNLVMNSIIHGFSDRKEGRMQLTVSEETFDTYLFVYGDDGKGISLDNQRQIFDPFFTTTRGSGGSGLGLSVVYNVVTQKLKGVIHCQPESIDGACFILKLPKEAPPIEK